MGVPLKILLLILAFSLTACSLYQSKGRKFLQTNAYQFSEVSAFALTCGPSETTGQWRELERTDKVIALQTEDFQLQVADSTFSRSCFFAFGSQEELETYLGRAEEFSLLNFSLGEFAFRH